MAKIMHDVGGLESGIRSSCIFGPYDRAIFNVNTMLSRATSLRENIVLRMLYGKDANVTQNGNYVREGFIYIPRKGIFITRCSPILAYAERATEMHRGNKEFYIDDWMAEEATASGICVRVPDKRTILIPVNRLADEEITAFVFGKEAKAYGEFLKRCGVEELPIWTVEAERDVNNLPIWTSEAEDKPFARQLWFYGLMYNGRSGLGGNDRCLHYGNAVRAVPDGDSLGYWD